MTDNNLFQDQQVLKEIHGEATGRGDFGSGCF